MNLIIWKSCLLYSECPNCKLLTSLDLCFSWKLSTLDDISWQLTIFVWVLNDCFSPTSISQSSDKIWILYEFIWWYENWTFWPHNTLPSSDLPDLIFLFVNSKGFILDIVNIIWHPSFLILNYLIVDNWIISHNICTGCFVSLV